MPTTLALPMSSLLPSFRAALVALVAAPFAAGQIPLVQVERLPGGTAGAFGEPVVQFSGAPVPGATLALSVAGAPPLAPGLLGLSTQVLPVPLPFLAGLVHVSPVVLVPFQCDASGRASGVVPPTFVDPALVGVDIVVQALVSDASVAPGAVLSDAARLRVGARTDILVGRAHPTAAEPQRIFQADLDADGRDELLVVGSESGLVFVHRVTDEGAFAITATLAVGTNPARVAFADFDGDGRVDAVVTNSASRTVSQLRGNGDGTFQPAVSHAVGSQPLGVSVGDVNGDTFVDVVVANANADTVSVLRGTASGTLSAATSFAVAAEPRELALADVNGDGVLDLVVGHAAANGLTVHRGFGNGSFGPSIVAGAVSQVGSLQVLDVDADTDADVVALASGGTLLVQLAGNGNGTFAPAWTASLASPTSGNLAVADLTGDGRPDVLRGAGAAFSIHPGNASGAPFGPPTTYAPAGSVNGTAAVDVNADGRLDVVLALAQIDVLSVYSADEGHGFRAAPDTPIGAFPAPVHVADLDGDGRSDVVTTLGAAGPVVARLGLGDGTFGPEITQTTVVEPGTPVLTDFDGDGEFDLVVSSASGSGSVVHVGGGDGTFAPGTPLAIPPAQIVLDVVDFDLDGVPDLFTLTPATGGGELRALRGDGSGGYQSLSSLQLADSASAIELAHLDGDGLLDLVVAYFVIDVVDVHLSSGVGRFAPPSTSLLVGDWPTSVTIEDVDLDGHRDLVVPARDFGTVSVFYNDGAGAFDALTQLRGVVAPTNVACVDLDANGVLDLAVGQSGPSNGREFVRVFLGRGGREFAEPSSFWTPVWASQVVDADFDADGRADLGVVFVGSNGRVAVLRE